MTQSAQLVQRGVGTGQELLATVVNSVVGL